MDDANNAANETPDFLAAIMGMWGAAQEEAVVVEAPAAPAPVVVAPKVERFESGTVRVTMHGLQYERGAKVRGRIVRWFAYTDAGRCSRVRNDDTIATLEALVAGK